MLDITSDQPVGDDLDHEQEYPADLEVLTRLTWLPDGSAEESVLANSLRRFLQERRLSESTVLDGSPGVARWNSYLP
ncbi:MAG: hypothetical protein HKP61_05555 [Dactylosporangium sp.]|nr:hypothetical protein [Dactylosporangium sp.]NNJ60413.1 hypothetical protein [Dactylosporangium sp.]